MDYELAKKLKDAGFPQDGFFFYAKTKGSPYVHWSYSGCCSPRTLHEEEITVPTLSELIEACGDRLESIRRTTVQWIITSTTSPRLIVTNASTLEEAVARLYLALNKNQNE